MLDKFLKITLIILILCVLCIASMLGIEMIKSRPHVDVEDYPTNIDYGILSEEQIETFDRIIYAAASDESVISCPVFSTKERHEIVTQLGLYFGDTEDIWDLVAWTDNRAILKLEEFKELFDQKIVIDARIDEAVSTLTEGSDAYKLWQISEYVSAKLVYTDDLRDPIAALNGKGLCGSYAMLFYKMSTRLRIPSYVCYGYTSNGVYHAWNAVELDGEYTYYDVTFYDQTLPGIRYISSKTSWDRTFQLNNRWSTDLSMANHPN